MTKLSSSNDTDITLKQLTDWCDKYLYINEYKDYAPNGLQVQAHEIDHPITHIVTGVTACDALIDMAIQQKAQVILVHHGYFWKGEDPRLIGMKGKRIRKLMKHGISLIGYHLPLDAHPVVGNNAQLAKRLGFVNPEPLYPQQKHAIGNIYTSQSALSADALTELITTSLHRQPLHIAGHYQPLLTTDVANNTQNTEPRIQRIGICTGAAQDMIEQAISMQCDAFISGEISERTTHTAREMGIDYYACGHHATEKGGIKALGELIASTFSVSVNFVDIDNPV